MPALLPKGEFVAAEFQQIIMSDSVSILVRKHKVDYQITTIKPNLTAGKSGS